MADLHETSMPRVEPGSGIARDQATADWQKFSASTALVRYTRPDSALLLSLKDVPGPRVAVLGGSFDPFHEGHLKAAQLALIRHNLNSVIFLPGSGNPEKAGHHFSANERFAMVHDAIRNKPGMYICPLHLAAFGDTPHPYKPMEVIKQSLPKDTELYFIMGSDYVSKLGHSEPLQKLVALCKPIFVERSGFDLNDVFNLLHSDQLGHSEETQSLVDQILDDLIYLGSPISSTAVKEFLARGEPPPTRMVPKQVRATLRKSLERQDEAKR
jgi:nicotinate-nucleotide adenylyltransferase